MRHRVIRRFHIFKWQWRYYLQEYCDYNGWETIEEISKELYEQEKMLL